MPELVIIGATPEGKKELVGLIDGVRESAQSWRELLLDLKRRGLAVAPELAIADGALGFWKAIEEVWPRTRSQRCWMHKTTNVLRQAAQEPALEGKACSRRKSGWPRPGTTQTAPSTPSSRPAPSNTTRRPHAWSRIARRCWRSTTFPPSIGSICAPRNPIESTVATVRHRTVRSKGCRSNKTALAMVFKLAQAAQNSWRRPRRTQPVAQADRRRKVHRRNRSRQATTSSRRLTQTVTKIRL